MGDRILVDITDMIAALIETGSPDADTGELPPGLEAARRQIMIFHAFMSSIPDLQYREVLEPLRQLESAFADLADGRRTEMLTPVNRGKGNPGKPSIFTFLQGLAARALHEFVEAGELVKSASDRVAKALGGRNDMAKVTGATVRNWRARLQEMRDGSEPSPGAPLDAWMHYMAPLPPAYGATPKQRGEALLKFLSDHGRFMK
jgi:hypothetical protein